MPYEVTNEPPMTDAALNISLVTTGCTIMDTDPVASPTTVTDSTTTVVDRILPTISGTVAGQAVTAPATITPFSTVSTADPNSTDDEKGN